MVLRKASAEEPSASERRRFVRFPSSPQTSRHLRAEVEGVAAGGRNISAGGLSLVMGSRPPVGNTLMVKLSHAVRRFSAEVPMRVRYVIEHPGGDVIVGGPFTRELTDAEAQGLL